MNSAKGMKEGRRHTEKCVCTSFISSCLLIQQILSPAGLRGAWDSDMIGKVRFDKTFTKKSYQIYNQSPQYIS